MAKKVTVISTSIRPNSNSELLAKSFAEGAEAAGNEVTFITLKDKDIRFCRGCLSCHQTGKCIIQDDVAPIMDAVLQADVVAWATPIYYFEMSGQMKTLIRRTTGSGTCTSWPRRRTKGMMFSKKRRPD